MGVKVAGLDELLHDLEALPARAQEQFPGVLGRGGLQIKLDWKRRWSPHIAAAPHHLPHVVRGIGYDVDRKGTKYTVEVGVSRRNPQASLAHFAELGSPTSAPYPGGLPALRTEAPKFVRAVAELAEKLLRGDE